LTATEGDSVRSSSAAGSRNGTGSVSPDERDVMARAFGRLDPVALGIAVGIVSGLALAFATAALLVEGGSLVGFHLKRLGYFLPGYTVSWPGVGIGFIDAAVVGFFVGVSVAVLWNAYHRLFVAVIVARERARAIRRELQEL